VSKHRAKAPLSRGEKIGVVVMWAAIAIFAALYWQYPHMLDWTGVVN
jgi:hypothetical protein